MDLAGEDRAVAWLIDAAQLLHDRRREPDLVPSNLAAPARDLDFLEGLPDRIGLAEVRRHQLRRQDVDLSPLAEQRGNPFGFLMRVQFLRLHRSSQNRSPGESRDPLIRDRNR